ncbi:MAG TPA: Holliday junction resolvase RuvX [Patescibacteria group bacterium]|nr:Holliday junction resolvase RuvX [Patescibacteria group bacterium]
MPIVAIKELSIRLPPKTRLLGMDHAAKALGLAVSNPELTVATPLATLRLAKFTENVKALAPLCRDYNIGGFVIGLPLNMDNTIGKRAEQVQSFAINLTKSKDLLGFDPVIAFIDESLTSFSAEDLMDEHRVNAKKKKDIIDQLAAAQVLQTALDYMQREKHHG